MTAEHFRHASATVLMIEIAEFMRVGQMLDSSTLCVTLHRLVTAFEDGLGVYRATGIGLFNGVYTAVAAEPHSHVDDAARFALFCISQADSIPIDASRPGEGTISLSVAMHCGPVTGIVVQGHLTLLGETVAGASRLLQEEGHGAAVGRVRCSGAVAAALPLEHYALDSSRVTSWNGKPTATYATSLVPFSQTRGLLGGAYLVCPLSLKITCYAAPFLSPTTQDVAGLLGYMPNELKHLRQLFGPCTDTQAIQAALARTNESMKPSVLLDATLYTRNGQATPLRLQFEFVPSMHMLTMSVNRQISGVASSKPLDAAAAVAILALG